MFKPTNYRQLQRYLKVARRLGYITRVVRLNGKQFILQLFWDKLSLAQKRIIERELGEGLLHSAYMTTEFEIWEKY